MSVVLISGGTGLVGTNLTRHLLERNYQVIILTRTKNKVSEQPDVSYSYWDVEKQIIDQTILGKADHIIHLAGAGVMDKKWTQQYKQVIVKSRTESAALLVKTLQQINHRVKTFISASAIGIYGPDPKPLISKEGFAESDMPHDNFLAETCVQWEAASEPVKNLGIRRVVLRQGIVLSNDGGAFKEFRNTIKYGVAPIFGDGRQVMSWIHIDDISRMFCEAINNEYLNGVYNAVAPEPVTQKIFMTRLGEKLKHRFFTPLYVPNFILKLMMGQRAIELLKSATVSDKKIRNNDFTFLYPSLNAAFEALVDG